MTSRYSVLIPSAKLVPESLQNLGKLPAVIYPVSQRIIFDYLYDQYEKSSSHIKVICSENSEEVIRKLSLYGNKVIVQVLPELRDLGYTIYYGLEGESDTVIINFADTIIMDSIFDSEGDCFYYSEDYYSDEWTYFTMSEGDSGAFTSITDKKQSSYSGTRGKLFVGLFVITEPQRFRTCLENAINNPEGTISTFYQALNDYNNICPMKALHAQNWFDIGHADKYFNSRLEVSAREFNHITIDGTRGILTKKSDNKEKFIQEIKWYLKLPSELEYIHPRIFRYSTHYNNPYVSMEYYAYHTVHELFLYGDMNFHQWSDIFRRIRSVYDDFGRYSVTGNNITPALQDMYLTKTLERLGRLKDDDNFSRFFRNSITINGRNYPSLNDICEVLRQSIPEMLYDVKNFNIIHGDLCFTNIMIAPDLSFIKLIDPRGSFGDYDIYGDSRYDLAKLLHSIDGKYDFIIKDMFSVDYDSDGTRIDFKISCSKRDFDLCSLFIETFRDEINNDIKSIKLIESLLFLSMIPLHNESIKHQLVMLATGIELLNQSVNIERS